MQNYNNKENTTQELKLLFKETVYFYQNMKKVLKVSEGVKAFAEKRGLDAIGKKILRSALKPLSDRFNVVVKGNGLILIPK